jgi:hypothetical protein
VDEQKAPVYAQDLLCDPEKQLSMTVRFSGKGLPTGLPVVLLWSAAEKKFQGGAQDGGKLSIAGSTLRF